MTKDVVISDSLLEFIKNLEGSDFHFRDMALNYHSRKGVEVYIMTGATLLKSHAEKDWENADCKNFVEWVEGEKKISHAQAVKMMSIAEEMIPLIPKYHKLIVKIPFVNLYQLSRIIKSLKDEKKLIELMHAAADCTERHFRDNIKELTGKTPTDICDHIRQATVITTVLVCERCGKALKRDEKKIDAPG